MLRTLFKKQFLEFNSGYFMNRKTGKMRSKGGIIGYVLLFVIIFALIGFSVYMIAADQLCKPFCALGLDWLYFAIMGLMSLVLSVFGSVFNTYNSLYLAKDNELLLSMPVKPGNIILARMSGVYGLALLFESIVYIPTVIAWLIYGNVTVLAVIYSVILMFLLGVISLVLTCVLGFLVALIASKTKNKSVVTVILSLVFFGVYFYLYSNLSSFITGIAGKGGEIAEKFESYAYICCIYGKASAGNSLYMLFFTAITALLFVITYFVLKKSFIKIVTFKSGSATASKSNINKGAVKLQSRSSALLKREFKHFVSCPVYMLNCGIGLIFMVAAAVLLIINADKVKLITELLSLFGFKDGSTAVFASVIMWLLISTCYFTAPSVSLEGNRLWILKTLPVDAKEIFASKQKMHLILAGVPAAALSVVAAIVLRVDITVAVLMTVANIAYVQLISACGLALNLLMPNLSWANETVPVKQSAPVMIVLFGGWIVSAGVGIGYFLLRGKISAVNFIVIMLLVTVLATRFINKFINEKGVKLFKEM